MNLHCPATGGQCCVVTLINQEVNKQNQFRGSVFSPAHSSSGISSWVHDRISGHVVKNVNIPFTPSFGFVRQHNGIFFRFHQPLHFPMKHVCHRSCASADRVTSPELQTAVAMQHGVYRGYVKHHTLSLSSAVSVAVAWQAITRLPSRTTGWPRSDHKTNWPFMPSGLLTAVFFCLCGLSCLHSCCSGYASKQSQNQFSNNGEHTITTWSGFRSSVHSFRPRLKHSLNDRHLADNTQYTYPYTDGRSHREQFGVKCLAQRHYSMPAGGAGDWNSNLWMTRRPTLPPELLPLKL